MAGSDDDALNRPPPTQQKAPSNRKYVSVFLFNHDLDNENPFSSVSLDQFEGTDFPFQLINGRLSLEDRLCPRDFSKFPDSKYSVFAKCEEGKNDGKIV